MHIHQHVAILDHGRAVTIPEDVGRPLVSQCYYWIHTHTPDGIIHVESPNFRSFTLGNLFDIWGQPLSRRIGRRARNRVRASASLCGSTAGAMTAIRAQLR